MMPMPRELPPNIEGVLISEQELERRVGELASAISADYAGRRPLLVAPLKGAFVFLADLIRRLGMPLEVDFVRLASYGAGTEPSGPVRLTKDLETDIAGRDVLIVEDIVDTGESLGYLIEALQRRSPASLHVCALLDKPERRRRDVRVDYRGFTIPDRFVVGYGLDCGEKYRELPYVGIMKRETPSPSE
jgi:hypoxanthine phosphoribosyltransferase